MPKPILYPALMCLALSACTIPKGGGWPTLSFGPEVEAMQASYDAPAGVALAPLPDLSAEEAKGLENKAEYLKTLDQDFSTLSQKLTARHNDYEAALRQMPNATDDQFRDAWLTAQMELSNIGLLAESLTRLRARIAALGTPLPEQAVVLKKRAEALELENRQFFRVESGRLFNTSPALSAEVSPGE